MPWFDRGIHPEFRKAEDRANQKEDRGPATPGDRIKQALTTPQSAEDAAAMRESIQSGMAGAGSVLGGGLQAATTAATIGGHVTAGVGAAAKQAVREVTSLPVVQETAANIGREAGRRISDAAGRVGAKRVTRGGLLGITTGRQIAGSFPAGSSIDGAEPSAASAPEAPSSREPGTFDVLLARVQNATSKPFARRQSGSLAQQAVTGNAASDAAPDAASEGVSYGTRVASVYNNAVGALTDYLLNQFRRTKRQAATDVGTVRALGPMNVGRAVGDAVTGHVREAIGELGEDVALSALEAVVGPEEQVLEDLAGFADIHAKHPQYLNQHTNLEVLSRSDQHGARYVRNPLTGRMGKIVEITDPRQEHIGPVIEAMFHGVPIPGDEEWDEAINEPLPVPDVLPEPRKARFVLSWLDGHPSNDWIHPEIAAHIRNPDEVPSPFGPLPRRQWNPLRRNGSKSGTSGLDAHNNAVMSSMRAEDEAEYRIAEKYGGIITPELLEEARNQAEFDRKWELSKLAQRRGSNYVDFVENMPLGVPVSLQEIEKAKDKILADEKRDLAREISAKETWEATKKEIPEFVALSEEQKKHAAGPMGWTMPGTSVQDHRTSWHSGFEGSLFSAPHSPEERARYLAENMEAMKRGSIVVDPRQQRRGTRQVEDEGSTSLTPNYYGSHVRSHAVLGRDQRALLSDPDVALWYSGRDMSSSREFPTSMAYRTKRWNDLIDIVGHEYPAPEGVNQEEWEKELKRSFSSAGSRMSEGDDYESATGYSWGGMSEGDDYESATGYSWGDPEAGPNDLERSAERCKREIEGRIKQFHASYTSLGGVEADKEAGRSLTPEMIARLSAIHDAPTSEHAKKHIESLDELFRVRSGYLKHALAKDDLSGSKYHADVSLELRRKSEGRLFDGHHGSGSDARPVRHIGGQIDVRNHYLPFDEEHEHPEDVHRAVANETWPYPHDYKVFGEDGRRYVQEDEMLVDDDEIKSERASILRALQSIPGQNFSKKDMRLLRTAIHTPHFEEGDSTLGEDAHRHAFAAGLKRAREHQEATDAGEDHTRSFTSVDDTRLSPDDLSVSLARNAPGLLANLMKVLRARIAEMETHNDDLHYSHSDDPRAEYTDTQIELSKRELQSTAELLEKFKWNPLVAGHARGTLWWETHPEKPTGLFPEEGAPTVKSFFHLTRTSALQKSMESKIRDEEKQQRRKIHREEIDEQEHGVEHEYDHGQGRHERKIMRLVEDSNVCPKCGCNPCRCEERGEAKVLRRMDQYEKKTRKVIDKEEDAQKKRIHGDHTAAGVPKFVAKYDHGINQHKRKLKKEITELRKEEKDEVQKDMDKSLRKLQKAVNAVDMSPDLLPATPVKPPVVPKLPKAPAVTPVMKSVEAMEKSKKRKKKSKWPSFDVQSSQIARREGVSEKAADAMLASRARNH